MDDEFFKKDSDKVKALLKERDALDEKIGELESESIELTNRVCEIIGSCPRCLTWHYPHCQPLST